jgi:hypothetical protein
MPTARYAAGVRFGRVLGFIVAAAALLAGADARADEGPMVVDRVVVRWQSPETGGPAKPQYIFERELAFEARLEALADREQEPRGFGERHVRAALDRHIAETMLASLPILPTPDPKEIAARAEAARTILEQRAVDHAHVLAAAAAEGMGSDELDAMLRREAKASLYLDRMVAPMLEPTELELRDVLRSRTTPFGDQPFDQVAPQLTRWYIGQKVSKALEAFYLTARSRVTVVIIRS